MLKIVHQMEIQWQVNQELILTVWVLCQRNALSERSEMPCSSWAQQSLFRPKNLQTIIAHPLKAAWKAILISSMLTRSLAKKPERLPAIHGWTLDYSVRYLLSREMRLHWEFAVVYPSLIARLYCQLTLLSCRLQDQWMQLKLKVWLQIVWARDTRLIMQCM